MTERCLLDRILEPGSLSVRFQPVVALDAVPSPHYFEALVRGPRGTSVENPAILFEYARRKSQEAVVDRACVEAILAAASILPAGAAVGINVHASTLAMDARFVESVTKALGSHGVAFDRLIVEILEHAPPWDIPAFRKVLGTLRRLGARIALDDVGLGHSNFMMILEEALTALSRAVHTLTVDADTLGLGDLAEVTHQVEGVLARLRGGSLATTRQVLDLLLASFAALRERLAAGHSK